MKWIAHRGASTKAVENTKKAFKIALESDYDGIECDIRLTKDQHFIVFHDETLDRLTPYQGYVKTYDEKTLMAMSYKQEVNEKILSLKQLITLMTKYQKTLLVEVKDRINDVQAKALESLFSDVSFPYFFISFHIDVLKKLSHPHKMLISNHLNDSIINTMKKYHIHHVDLCVDSATEQVLKKCQKENITVSLWTVNDNQDIWKNRSIAYITTDEKK